MLTSSSLIIIRYALLAFVLASGAALEELESKGLLEASEMRSIVQRRRRGSRYLGVMSDASISKGLMATLKRFVACDSFALRALVCKALFVVLAGSSACANAEDLILLHADSLASCIYRAFDPMQECVAALPSGEGTSLTLSAAASLQHA